MEHAQQNGRILRLHSGVTQHQAVMHRHSLLGHAHALSVGGSITEKKLTHEELITLRIKSYRNRKGSRALKYKTRFDFGVRFSFCNPILRLNFSRKDNPVTVKNTTQNGRRNEK